MFILAEIGVGVSILISLLIAAASIAMSILLRPKPDIENQKPAGSGDFKFPTADEGRAVPVQWGTCRHRGPNVVWWGDFKAKKIREEIKTGLFSSKKITIGYEYFAGMQMAVCRGDVNGLRRLWIGDKLVVDNATPMTGPFNIDEPKLFGGNKFGTGGIVGTLTMETGSDTQVDHPYLLLHQSPTTPYRGICYFVWEGGNLGNSTQIKPWSFEIARFPNQLGIPGGRHVVNSEDANPAAVAYEILTDVAWGLGIPSTEIDAASFLSAADTLHTEGNGFSFILDQKREAQDILDLLQDQCNCVFFEDRSTGLLTMKLGRADYDIDLVPQITDANIVEVKEFTRAAWDETVNQIHVGFDDRTKDYKEAWAIASDIANQQNQAGQVVPVQKKFPGVKDRTQAANLASRDLRELSVPLAKATVTVDRSFNQVNPGDAVAWTDTNLGFTKLPMRVMKISYGTQLDGTIRLHLFQDPFKFTAAFFADPDDTLWVPPTDALTAPAATEQFVIEAPFAFARRDPEQPGVVDRIWASMRAQGPESAFKIHQRNAPVTPAGAYTEDSDDIPGFVLIGTLGEDLVAQDQAGTQTIRLDSTPDTLATLDTAFTPNASNGDIGQNLVNLVAIGDGDFATTEFIGVANAVDQGSHVDLTGVWRGLMDTAPLKHPTGKKVFLIFNGGDMNNSVIDQTNVVDVQLRASSFSDEITEGEAVTVQIQMDNRVRRAMPPAQKTLNGGLYSTAVNIDALRTGGSTLDERGVEVTYNRRQRETLSETDGIENDLAPSRTTRYRLTVDAATQPLLHKCRAFWKLEEDGLTVRADEVGHVPMTPDLTIPNATGRIGNAADFPGAAATERLRNSVTSEKAAVSFGDEDFMIAGWFNLDDDTVDQVLISKWQNLTNDREYQISFLQASNTLTLFVSDNGTAVQSVASTVTLSTGTWYFVRAWHDSVNDELGIEIDFGDPDTAAHATGINKGATDVTLGGRSIPAGGQPLNGKMDAWGIWSRILTNKEIAELYNGDAGNEYPFDNPPTSGLIAGLQSFYRCEESTGTRTDAVGSEDVSEVGGDLASTTGIIGDGVDHDSEPNVFGGARLEGGVNTHDFSGNQDFMLVAWVNVSTTSFFPNFLNKWGGSGDNAYLFGIGSNDNGGSGSWRFVVTDDGTTGFANVNTDGGLLVPTTGVWHMVVGWHDGVNDELGIEIDTTTRNTLAHTLGVFDSAEPFRWGMSKDCFGNLGRPCNGIIDNVLIYNKILTVGQRKCLYYGASAIEHPFTAFDSTVKSQVFQGSFLEGDTLQAPRQSMMRNTAGALPPFEMCSTLETEHDFDAVTRAAKQNIEHEFKNDLDTATTFKHCSLGAIDDNVVSDILVAETAGTYTFNLGTALTTGLVEARINGGAFATVIAATQTTGNLAGVAVGDTIEVRHTQTGAGTSETFLEIDVPSSTRDAYAILLI